MQVWNVVLSYVFDLPSVLLWASRCSFELDYSCDNSADARILYCGERVQVTQSMEFYVLPVSPVNRSLGYFGANRGVRVVYKPTRSHRRMISFIDVYLLILITERLYNRQLITNKRKTRIQIRNYLPSQPTLGFSIMELYCGFRVEWS